MRASCLGLVHTASLIFILFCIENIQVHPSIAADNNSQLVAQSISAAGQTQLRSTVQRGELASMLRPSFFQIQRQVQEFYASCQYGLPWIRNSQPTPQARALIQAFANAQSRGLRPGDYDGPQWTARLSNFDRNPQLPESVLVEFDVAVTVAAMRYLSDLHTGRVNPRLFHFGFDVDRGRYDLAQFLGERLVNASDTVAVLQTVDPPFPGYQRTLAALHTYQQLATTDTGESLGVPKKPVAPEGSYDGISRLTRLLTLEGDLPSNAATQTESTLYTEPLVSAVKRFQARHGLDENGQIDAPTVRELNVPFRERVEQLEVVLERWRWVPHEFARPPVVVNIPEFRLHVNDQQYHWVLSMRVVVGKAYRHQTPVFASEMKYVTFRPDWNVPAAIQRDEIVPELAKHPEDMQKKDYEVVDRSGKVVAQDISNPEILEQLRSGKLGIRQRPGANNSLGRIKFGIPNDYGIYLHGTPAQELFAKSRRDFSHGCIRVEDPAGLAAWVLRDKPEWTPDRIREAMDADRSVTVKLENPIPVLIIYGTAVVSEDQQVYFFRDIYGHDAALEKVLAAQAHE
jgi:murein L,D-transpeptidase YcbB/YkuD